MYWMGVYMAYALPVRTSASVSAASANTIYVS
jgi:hypothetical protein